MTLIDVIAVAGSFELLGLLAVLTALARPRRRSASAPRRRGLAPVRPAVRRLA